MPDTRNHQPGRRPRSSGLFGMPGSPPAAVDDVLDGAEEALREGAYVTVGLAVLAFQRAQVERRELAKRLSPLASQWSEQRSGAADGSAAERDRRSEEGDRLSDQLGEISRSFATNVGAARAQLVELARTWDEWAAPVRRQVDEQIDAVAELLPEGARGLVGAVRSAMAGPEARLRAAVGLD